MFARLTKSNDFDHQINAFDEAHLYGIAQLFCDFSRNQLIPSAPIYDGRKRYHSCVQDDLPKQMRQVIPLRQAVVLKFTLTRPTGRKMKLVQVWFTR
jgi:hypothetical protein